MTERPTDEQVREWLYAIEYDWTGDCPAPLPSNPFPPYYAADYQPIFAAVFRELLEGRNLHGRAKALCELLCELPQPINWSLDEWDAVAGAIRAITKEDNA